MCIMLCPEIPPDVSTLRIFCNSTVVYNVDRTSKQIRMQMVYSSDRRQMAPIFL